MLFQTLLAATGRGPDLGVGFLGFIGAV